MAIEHIAPNGSQYTIHYRELRSRYARFCEMSDDDFIKALPEAAHLACIIGWFKELDADMTIGDTGIIHELIHLITGAETQGLPIIREMFREYLKLV